MEVVVDSRALSLEMEEALLDLDRARVEAILARATSDSAFDRCLLADDVIAVTLERIGRGWENGTVALSQVYMAGRIIERAVGELSVAAMPEDGSLIAIGVLGDFHTLGKSMVASALRAAGNAVLDLGAGHSPVELARRAQESGAGILLVSVLMVNRALQVGELREQMDRVWEGPRIPIGVGGAPFVHDRGLWKRVGADYVGASAADALRIAQRWRAGRAA